jgi:hypothetical protein
MDATGVVTHQKHGSKTGADQQAIDLLPQHAQAQQLTSSIKVGAKIMLLVWTAVMAIIVYLFGITRGLDIVFILSYTGWILASL